MDIVRLTDITHPLFSAFWEIYNDNFPKTEKRNLKQQEETFVKKEYALDIYRENDVIKGFLAYWSFPEFIFVEHLAISKEGQGKGLGKTILQNFIKNNTLPIILEIEHPVDETSIRRLNFYERLGFVKNHHLHFQPPFIKGDAPLGLTVLSLEKPFSATLYASFARKQKEVIMNHQY